MEMPKIYEPATGFFEGMSLSKAVDAALSELYGGEIAIIAADEYQSRMARGLPFGGERIFVRGIVRHMPVRKMSLRQTAVQPEEKAKKYGSDAFRLSLIMGCGFKKDIRFCDAKAAAMSRFCNKIWNAGRFVLALADGAEWALPDDALLLNEAEELKHSVSRNMEALRPGLAAEEIYRFVRKRFCGVYIERCKAGQISPAALRSVLTEILTLLYPFAPELCGRLRELMNGSNAMNYRRLGKTGLMVSEIGFGGEWLDRHSVEECVELIHHCEDKGINILDCWMSDPDVRSKIGAGIAGRREKWYIQGHIGSTWQDGQYLRTRDIAKARAAFEDMLSRFDTDYIDLGMIHYVDAVEDWETIIKGEFLQYVMELKESGAIRHIGISTHNPEIAQKAAKSGFIEMIMFSINPAFDMMPGAEDVEVYFGDNFDTAVDGITPERMELYRLCEEHDVGITVMKGYAGGRLLKAEASPFGVALTPVQCLHYCLTRPMVGTVMVGFDTTEQVDEAVAYEYAGREERDYASVLAGAPAHAYHGQCTYCGHCKPCPVNIDIAMVNKLYDLATMQPEVPASLREHYKLLQPTAVACIACSGCETRCPFGVKVAQRMAKAKDLFGE